MTAYVPPSLAESQRWARGFAVAAGFAVLAAALALLAFDRYAPDRPADYRSEREHFFYGSIGSDISGGLPLRVVKALPRLFPEYLPKGAARHDYTAFGFIQEPGHK